MRRAANRSNGTPHDSSNRRAASTKPSVPARPALPVNVTRKVRRDLKNDVIDKRQVLSDQLNVISTLAHVSGSPFTPYIPYNARHPGVLHVLGRLGAAEATIRAGTFPVW